MESTFLRFTYRLTTTLFIFAVAAPLVLWFSFAQLDGFRIELGATDDAFLRGHDSAWGRGYKDTGPFRIRRGVRWMTRFVARLAKEGAGLHLPVTVEGGDSKLRLRAHRYGQPGIVYVFGNGVHLGSLFYAQDSYPWDVRELRVPGAVFRAGSRELRLDFSGEDTVEEVDLPFGAVVALDWVELVPSPSARLRPSRSQWMWSLLMPLLVSATLWWGGTRFWVAQAVGWAILLVIAVTYVAAPGATSGALEHLWMVFPVGVLAWMTMRGALRISSVKARALATAFTMVLMAHSTILFFPHHLPPDLGPHLGQMQRLNESQRGLEDFWRFSSSFGETGKGKPHFGANYEAPYPPWTYFLAHGLRQLIHRPRFLIEFIAMVSAAVMMLLTYGISRHLSNDPRAAGFAAALAAVEISIWHHASRAHTPGSLGAVFFLAAVLYLVHHYESMRRVGVLAGFALLSFAATIVYTATLFHFVFFIAWLVTLEFVERPRMSLGVETRRLLAGAVSGTLGSLVVFYRHFVGTALTRMDAILAVEGYRAPATFFFLRNQMRDTVRILRFGFPVWVVLALPAYFNLRSWLSGAFARRVVLAWTATYALLLLLKDPLFFPQLFLHVKEDLLFAPLVCLLGGLTLSRISAWGRAGKIAVASILAGLLLLQLRDYGFNADTILAGPLE